MNIERIFYSIAESVFVCSCEEEEEEEEENLRSMITNDLH
jgi:hypothetical protein